MIVRLTDGDRASAEDCAALRIADAERLGYRDRFRETSRRSHYLGALGEMAFARFMGRPWICTTGEIGGRPDLGRYEVRAIGPENPRAQLKIKSNDREGTRVVMVMIVSGLDDAIPVREHSALIAGWVSVPDAKRFGKYSDPGGRGAPAWFVSDMRRLQWGNW